MTAPPSVALDIYASADWCTALCVGIIGDRIDSQVPDSLVRELDDDGGTKIKYRATSRVIHGALSTFGNVYSTV